MKLMYVALLFSTLAVVPTCSRNENTTTNHTEEEKIHKTINSENTTISTTTEHIITDIPMTGQTTTITSANTTADNDTEVVTGRQKLNWNTKGIYGGSYYNYDDDNSSNIHYIHGIYQSPKKNYYSSQNYYRKDEGDQTLDYYLGFGISKITDQDFRYDDFHHYYHNLNRTITENETIRMDYIIACHPNTTFLCPENTETVCMLNGTLYCMSRISAVGPCIENSSMDCVNSTVPCIRNCALSQDNLEEISLPCLAKIILRDIYEERRLGNVTTIAKVGGTFVIVPPLEPEEKIFCVSVVVDPVPPDAYGS